MIGATGTRFAQRVPANGISVWFTRLSPQEMVVDWPALAACVLIAGLLACTTRYSAETQF